MNSDLLGENFSLQQFLNFISSLQDHPQASENLAAVLMSLKPAIFSQALGQLNQEHLNAFKQDHDLEPLCYQLTLFLHEGQKVQEEIEQILQTYLLNIITLANEDITKEKLEKWNEQIQGIEAQIKDYLFRTSYALALAWNTNRIDLIEKLSQLKEGFQRQFKDKIGQPLTETSASTGLYNHLEQALGYVFDGVPPSHLALKDSDAAIDGLACLSIWQLKDYWELGLLPNIQEEADLESSSKDAQERQAYHQHLFSLAQQNLAQLQLETVGDLKKARLFSLPLLKAYIDRYRHLMINS